MQNSIYYVYVHKKTTDGSVFYVGKGKLNRCYNFRGRSPHWNRVKAKHGVKVEIVFDYLTEHQAFFLEKKMIQKIGITNLVNVTPGGEGVSMPWTEDSREKRVAAIRKSVASDSWRRNQERHWNCEKYKERTSQRMKRILSRPEVKKRQKEAIKAWASSEENKKRVSEFFTGRKKPPQWIEKARKRNIGRKLSVSQKSAFEKANKEREKPVVCLDNGIVFETARKAAEWAAINGCKNKSITQQIRHVCKGRMNTAAGYKWKYQEDI